MPELWTPVPQLPHDEFEAYVEHVMSTLIPPIPPAMAA